MRPFQRLDFGWRRGASLRSADRGFWTSNGTVHWGTGRARVVSNEKNTNLPTRSGERLISSCNLMARRRRIVSDVSGKIRNMRTQIGPPIQTVSYAPSAALGTVCQFCPASAKRLKSSGKSTSNSPGSSCTPLSRLAKMMCWGHFSRVSSGATVASS